MLIADVRVDGLDREHWHSWPKHDAGWLALCPLPSTDSFQFQAQIPADEPADLTLERLQQIVYSFARRHVVVALSAQRPDGRSLSRRPSVPGRGCCPCALPCGRTRHE